MAITAPAPRVLADLVPSAIVRNVVLVVAGAAFVAASAQIAFYLPWNPVVPLTLQTFAVVLAAGALGTWRGVSAMVLYTAVGSLGAPIFRLGGSGWGGPTFGYVLAFIVAAAVVGRLAENGGTRRFWQSVGLMLLGQDPRRRGTTPAGLEGRLALQQVVEGCSRSHLTISATSGAQPL